MNKRIILPILAIAALVGVTLVGVGTVKADEDTHAHPMIQALVERFNLNEDEVETLFSEQREQHQAQMQEHHQDRLNDAVSDGVISEDQKNALQEKWDQMHEEREQERQEHHEEMEAWMQEQDIDHDALREYIGFGEGGFGKMGKGMMRGQ